MSALTSFKNESVSIPRARQYIITMTQKYVFAIECASVDKGLANEIQKNHNKVKIVPKLQIGDDSFCFELCFDEKSIGYCVESEATFNKLSPLTMAVCEVKGSIPSFNKDGEMTFFVGVKVPETAGLKCEVSF